MPDSALPTNLTNSFWETYVRPQLITSCLSTARPTGVEGRHIWEVDTQRLMVYTAGTWQTLNGGIWASYTPAWTNLSVGNGTVAARYCYVPGGIRLTGRFVWGTTSSITGNVTQTIPNSEVSTGVAAGAFVAIDAITEYTCSVQCFQANSAFIFYGQTGNWAASNPFTPASGDQFVWDITIPL